jgi:predicted 3-demethylubiquinone-9 3-methyltransferase (glyoxalase superfamily)
MKNLAPCLWFSDGNCEEAIQYYVDTFPDSHIQQIVRYPDATLDEHFEGMEGKVVTAEFTLDGHQYIALDGGPVFRFNEAISITILCDDQAEIDHFWDKLSFVPEAEQCGWAKDQFGLSWQIIPANMGALQTKPAQIQAMMQMKKFIIQDLVDLA